MPGIVWLHRRSECGRSPRLKRRDVGSERKGSQRRIKPDKFKAVTRGQPERKKAGPCRCLDGMAGRRVREGIFYLKWMLMLDTAITDMRLTVSVGGDFSQPPLCGVLSIILCKGYSREHFRLLSSEPFSCLAKGWQN